jgi:hypothetical protein
VALSRGSPAKAAYAPLVLYFSVAIAGDQYDRVASVWLDGTKLLCTTTAEPTPDGVRWTVRKDVKCYSALLRSSTAAWFLSRNFRGAGTVAARRGAGQISEMVGNHG